MHNLCLLRLSGGEKYIVLVIGGDLFSAFIHNKSQTLVSFVA